MQHPLITITLLLALIPLTVTHLQALDTPELARLLREGKEAEIVEKSFGGELSGEGAFIAGVAAYRLKRFDVAARLLDAASRHPIPVRDYALLFRARALSGLDDHDASAATHETLITTFPDSRLVRQALFERCEELFAAGRHQESITACETAIRRFPTGPDAIRASLTQARGRIETKGFEGAIRQLRLIIISSPASPEAESAQTLLDRLASTGKSVPPLTDEERFKRAGALAETGQTDRALKELETLATRKDPVFSRKVRLRITEILFRARRYQTALDTVSGLLAEEIEPAPLFWKGRILARLGKREEAANQFRELSGRFPRSDRGDDALYHEALLMMESKQREAGRTLLLRLIQEYPKSTLLHAARWEIALSALLDDLPDRAHPHLLRLVDDEQYRERALYWLSVVETRRTGSPGSWLGTLAAEYPFGFYATILRAAGTLPPLAITPLDRPLDAILPEPAGFERERFLMSCGMTADTIAELRVREKRDPSPARRQQIARLYLSLDRFDGLYRQGKELVDRKAPSTLPLALYYPPAYFDMVKQLSARYHVPAALLLALVRAESSYDPSARSPAGAIGLTQLLPATARGMMKEISAGSLTDPALNLSLGARHLRDLLTRYQGDPLPALAAYNAGSTVVDRWLSERKGYDRILLIESIPYRETREYVKKIIAASDIYVRLYPDLSGEVPLVGQFIGKQGTS